MASKKLSETTDYKVFHFYIKITRIFDTNKIDPRIALGSKFINDIFVLDTSQTLSQYNYVSVLVGQLKMEKGKQQK